MSNTSKPHSPVSPLSPRHYSPTTIPPYGWLAAMFVAGLSGALALLGRRAPHRWQRSDILLLAIGTHKLSRIISKERVTSPLRAPFTKLEGGVGGGEVEEKPRGSGLQRAVGELITCPYCVGAWVASGLAVLLVANRRLGRFILVILTAMTGSDFLQGAYAILRERSRR